MQQFSEAVRNKDVEKAWEILSRGAEATLTALQAPVEQVKLTTKLHGVGQDAVESSETSGGAELVSVPAEVASEIEENVRKGPASTPRVVPSGQLGGVQPAQTYHSGRRNNATQAQGYAGLWRIPSLATQRGLLQVSWCPSYGKRPEWKCEPPTTTEVARGLNDLADKAAGEALTVVKHEVQEKEERMKEDVAWAKRALQTVAKVNNEYTDHIGFLPVFHKNPGSALISAH